MLEFAVVGYIVLSCFIAFYSISQLLLLLNVNRYKQPKPINYTTWPKVLIQLPIYNEANVIEDLLNAVNQLDYPSELLEIQLLDDSIDSTAQVIENWLNENTTNFTFTVVNRAERTGFKAGALQYGLEKSSSEFVAIFDADFLPNPSFLKEALPLFHSENVGVVQTKWTYINENESLLTRLQAFGLVAHFQIEQQGRSAIGAFLNFNGTAGIWRKSCIYNAGGWKFDSLTEDLDLSYRAQLLGYKIEYTSKIGTPSLLPNTMIDVKNQQFRWTKGAAQCLRLHLVNVWKSDRLNFLQKLISTLHLANELVFLAVLLASVLSISAVYYKANFFSGGPITSLLLSASALIGAFIILALFYFKAHKEEFNSSKKATLHLLKYYLPFLSFTMALSVKNSRAVLEGLFGVQSDFIRTPKQKKEGIKIEYTVKTRTVSFYLELVLLVFYLLAFAYAISVGNITFMVYYGLLIFGFGAVTIKQI